MISVVKFEIVSPLSLSFFVCALSNLVPGYSVYLWGHGNVVVSTLDFNLDLKVGGSRTSPCHRVVSLHKKLYPGCLSPPRCINGYQRHTAGGNPVLD